tara:strand:+ start:69 stop:389 length:321 start_codon:yes stop_codon:yes gene_type:complete
MSKRYGIIAKFIDRPLNKNIRKKMNLFFFLVTLLVFSNSALSNEADVIKVASLAVKERIQSIEEINVTAKNPTDGLPASNAKIEKILDEAATLEKVDLAPNGSRTN